MATVEHVILRNQTIGTRVGDLKLDGQGRVEVTAAEAEQLCALYGKSFRRVDVAPTSKKVEKAEKAAATETPTETEATEETEEVEETPAAPEPRAPVKRQPRIPEPRTRNK